MLLLIIIVDQDDYISRSVNVTFGPDESEKSVLVSIINDSSRERSEDFFSHLTISHQSEDLMFQQVVGATIVILYNDCKKINSACSIQISGTPPIYGHHRHQNALMSPTKNIK